MVWMEHRKAFDSIPHPWIESTLKIYHILIVTMKNVKTILIIKTVEGPLESNEININMGIFQGESLSPLLFCMSLLSHELEQSGQGYCFYYLIKKIGCNSGSNPPGCSRFQVTHTVG